MEEKEKQVSHEEGLKIIRETISRTKDNFIENSFYFMLWGWLIALASFAFFVLQYYTATRFFFVPFPIAAIAGIGITVAHYIRYKAATPTESYTSSFLSKFWIVLGISFILTVYFNVSQGNVPFTQTLLLAGVGTLVSGWVMQFKPMIYGGILFWLAALLSLYLADDYIVLLHGVAIIAGYLIPGYLLKYSDKR